MKRNQKVLLLISIIIGLLVLVAIAFISRGESSHKTQQVEVELYAEFNCSECVEVYRISKELDNIYEDYKVSVYFIGVESTEYEKHTALLSAEKQGKYSEFFEKLFIENYNEDLGELAKEMELDLSLFNEDRNSLGIRDKVDQVRQRAISKGIDIVPTLLVNGRFVSTENLDNIGHSIEEIING